MYPRINVIFNLNLEFEFKVSFVAGTFQVLTVKSTTQFSRQTQISKFPADITERHFLTSKIRTEINLFF